MTTPNGRWMEFTNDPAQGYILSARDNAGRQVSYQYDTGRLWKVIDVAGGITEYGYDPFGRRTRKTLGGLTTDYLYDGDNPVQELSGGVVLANLLTGLGIDEYFTRTDGSGRRSLLGDALGSILALTDDAGVVQTQYTYEPFGATTVTGQGNGSPFEYTGRENDGTGLYYYRAQYYSPALGRFVAEDPARRSGDNPYAYVANSPLIFVDPSGLQPIPFPIPCWWCMPAPPPPPSRPSPPSPPPAPSSPSPMPNEKIPKNPPPNWQPRPGAKPDTWIDPHGDTWHWHDDPKHGPRHWDTGGPSEWGEKGKQEWWPEGGKRGPKPPGKDRKVSFGGGGTGGGGGMGGFGGWGAGGGGFGGRKDF